MSENDPVRDNPVVNAIRKARADSLVVHVGDKTETVAVPKAGARWSKLAKLLDALDWDSVDAYDAAGRLLGRIPNPDIADEEEEEDADEPQEDQLVKLANVITGVVKTTMTECRTMFEAQLQGQAALTTAMVEGMNSVTESYKLALQVQAAATMHASSSRGGEESDGIPPGLMQMMQAVMMMQSRSSPSTLPSPQPRPVPAPTPKKEGQS